MEPITVAELLRMASLMTAVYAAGAGLVLLLAPAEVWSWPHPVAAVRSALESGAVDLLLIAVANVMFAARAAAAVSREFARDVAALFVLLTTSPKGELA
ncbi:hypothetical protein ABT215_11295 [Streptomyces sp900105755]|uniref:hypothetical protein n=1 Tax=Streptomyces sp. 900105755 TaxID=3154389 RepID=UPI0033273B40